VIYKLYQKINSFIGGIIDI